ncbi:MAG: hypothetical protein QOI82_333 [Actinomycetota bacterium]|jgi:hypothetical protein|nr:hypothetical protein [Actinomycetota bacterium]
MVRRRVVLLPIAVIAAGLPLAGAAIGASPACGSELKPPPLAFGNRVYIDKNRAGGEPVSVVAKDGSISVSSHAGTTHIYKDPSALGGASDFLVGYSNETLNWRSTDGGKTWTYVGLPLVNGGPHSASSTGFSDPDYAIDAAGRIYNTEIDLANVSVFSSGDDGQTYSRGNPEVTSGDRPWLTGGHENEVYLYVNTGQQIWHSTDGGITWALQSQGNSKGPDAKMYIDPANPKTGLIGPHNPQGVAISADQGKTWKAYDGASLGDTVDFFGAVAVDKAGNVYRAAAGGYNGASDKKTEGSVTFNYFSRKTNTWAPDAVTIPTSAGDKLWPWVVAGDDGRVAVTWLQNKPGKPTEFSMYVAETLNAHGSWVTCKNGQRKFIQPQWSVANASHTPVQRGPICLSGTACNASTDFPAGDRRLGDFLTINYDKNGRLFITGGDTSLPSATGGPKPVSNPIFIAATKGAKLIKHPMHTAKTRPSCTVDPTC